MGVCQSATTSPVKPLIDGYIRTSDEYVQYDPNEAPFYRMRPEDKRPIRFAVKGTQSEKETPPSTLLKAFYQAKSIHGDSPALKVESPCPPLNPDGSVPTDVTPEWKTWTYIEYWNDCRSFAKSLLAVDIKRYEGVVIFGFNSPEWAISCLGVTMAGGLSSGIYPTDSPESIRFKTVHSGAKIAIVEDAAKLAKFEEVLDEMPKLTYIVGYSPSFQTKKFLRRKDGTSVEILPFKDFLELGKEIPEEKLDVLMEDIKPEDCFCLIYTSGTTGNPKAVMISHDNVIVAARGIFPLEPSVGASGQERVLSYLPLSHIAGLMFDVISPIAITAYQPGYCTVHFARPYDLKAGTLVDRIKAVEPTLFFGVPRVFEKMKEKLEVRFSEAPAIRKFFLKKALAAGLAYHENCQLGGTGNYPPGYQKHVDRVLGKIQKLIGFSQIKLMVTGAAPIDRSTIRFFGSLGLSLNEVYGMSESTGGVTLGTSICHVAGSCGSAYPGAEVKVFMKKGDEYVECPKAKDIFNPTEEEQGELCYRGRTIMIGYMSNQEIGDQEEVLKKNQDAIDSNGWLHSGDKGCVSEKGLFRITGRFKELIIGAGGENIAPVSIEDSIKRFGKGVISNCHMIGDRRKYNIAFITLVTKGATGEKPGSDELDGLARELVPGVTTVTDAIKSPKFLECIEQWIASTNDDGLVCPSHAARITKYTILPLDYSIETGELTATLKLKRGYAEQKYAAQIDAMYLESLPKDMFVPFSTAPSE